VRRSPGSARTPRASSSQSAERISRLPASAWFAYPIVLGLQARALWGIWDNDLTVGDTAGYWQHADLWFDHLQVNIAWSPVYTAFLGTLRMLFGDDAVTAVTVHRVLIVLAVAVVVLALMRRLLPPAVALLVACWWAVLPINFDTLYEVHLFSVLPLLGTVLLLTGDPGPWRRGWALALALGGAMLVRNETALVVAGLAVALAVAELRARRRGGGIPLGELAVATLVPLAVALAAVGFAYDRSILQGQAAVDGWQAKQALNVCQVYGTNYAQRHPEYTENPYLECDSLMLRTFEEPRPTLADAWSANPRAMAAFTAWNLHLLPGGVQLGLFARVTADDNPGYVPARLSSTAATLLTVALLVLLGLGGRMLWRDRDRWRSTLACQRWAWLALGLIAVATVAVVVLDARPRPSYMFGLTAGIMASGGLAFAALVRGRSVERWVGVAAVALPVVLIVALPAHYRDEPHPVGDQYERLRPVVPDAGPARLVVPAYSGEACAYLVPTGPCKGLSYAPEIAPKLATRPLPVVLDAERIDVVYADASLLSQPPVARLAAHPSRFGWRVAASGGRGAERWVVLMPAGGG
jgi:hypothetical protein